MASKTKLQDTHLLIHFHVYIKLLKLTFSSDLRKPCCKLAKACLLSQNCSVSENIIAVILIMSTLNAVLLTALVNQFAYRKDTGLSYL